MDQLNKPTATAKRRGRRGGGTLQELERGKRFRLKVVTGYNESGNPVQRTETFHGTKAQASERLAQLVYEASAARGKAPDPRQADQRTLASLLQQWLLTEPRKASTLAEYRRLVEAITEDLGSLTLTEVKPSGLNGYYRTLREGGMKDPTIRRRHAILSATFNWAEAEGIVERSPVTKEVKIPKASRPKSNVIPSKEEAKALLERALVEDPTLYCLVSLDFSTGLRRGELTGLKWSSVHLDGPVPYVSVAVGLSEAARKQRKNEGPKSDAGVRQVHLDPRIVEILRDHLAWQEDEADRAGKVLAADPYMLSYKIDRSVPPSGSGLLHAFQRLCHRMNLPQYTIQSMRHWHGTELYGSAQIADIDIAQRMGHSNASVTKRYYAHARTEQDQKSANVIGSVLFGEEAS